MHTASFSFVARSTRRLASAGSLDSGPMFANSPAGINMGSACGSEAAPPCVLADAAEGAAPSAAASDATLPGVTAAGAGAAPLKKEEIQKHK